MTYYDTVHTKTDFLEVAKDKNATSFEALRNSPSWRSAASSWGIQQLCSSRVLCAKPTDNLPILGSLIKKIDEKEFHSTIASFISGPGDLGKLRRSSELRVAIHSTSISTGVHLWKWMARASISIHSIAPAIT